MHPSTSGGTVAGTDTDLIEFVVGDAVDAARRVLADRGHFGPDERVPDGMGGDQCPSRA
jgi:hypothetical protein